MIDDWWFTKFTMLIYGLWLMIDGLLSYYVNLWFMIDDWWFTKFTMLIYGLWLMIDGLLSLLC